MTTAILVLGEIHSAMKNQTLARWTPVTLGKYREPPGWPTTKSNFDILAETNSARIDITVSHEGTDMTATEVTSESAELGRKRPFHRFDLNLLRALEILLEERNVTHAANRMNVTQPTMSAALQKMRDYFGDQLLIKVGRDMELTPLARSLSATIPTLLIEIRRTLDAGPRFDPKVAKRNFAISMTDYAAFVMMPRLLERLAREAPYISCSVEPISEVSFGRLASNEVDFSVASDRWRGYGDYGPGPDIRSQLLFTDDFVCVVDPSTPAVPVELTLEEYLRMQHLTVRLGRGISSIVENVWVQNDLSITVAATASTFSTLMCMVPGTPHVATVQRRLARRFAGPLGLREMPCPVPIPPLQESLIWHARNDFEPGHQFMRDLIAEAARHIDQPPAA
jgi:LysR family transcriptional regulator, nod-box dependent transcriptional activator